MKNLKLTEEQIKVLWGAISQHYSEVNVEPITKEEAKELKSLDKILDKLYKLRQ